MTKYEIHIRTRDNKTVKIFSNTYYKFVKQLTELKYIHTIIGIKRR